MAKKPTAKKLIKEQAQENPRRAIFRMSPQVFLQMFNGRHYYEVTEFPLPLDCKVIDCRLETWTGAAVMEVLLEHPSLDPLSEGMPIPYIKVPVFTALSEGETIIKVKE